MARNNRRLRHSGVAIVEMAIVLPLLLLLTFAMIEYGWLFSKSQQVTNATRQAARTAALHGAEDHEVVTAIIDFMAKSGLEDSGYSFTIEPGSIDNVQRGETVKVEISVPYSSIALTSIPLPVPETIRASVSMTKE